MAARTFNVLFLCTGNSARSILAECILRHRGKGVFSAFSAGSFPKGEVHPLALNLLAEHRFPITGLRSKSWNEFAAAGATTMDFVFTVCDQAAGEICPIWPGQPITAHSGIPDPAAVDGSEAERMLAFRDAFRDAFRTQERRIKIFISLPIAPLDRMALTRHVEAIGRMRPDTAEDQAS
jgi:arsenate reductase (thioredoxin)